jgi:cysteinyl-tRNA synthetase
MSEKHLGTEFEIHGGGLDLVFPHHENEIAQSQSLGHRFAHVWMHNGMLGRAGDEMHKSLGNDVSLRTVVDTWGREAILLFFMSGLWRKPIEFSDETMAQAKAQAGAFRNYFAGLEYESDRSGEWNLLAEILDDDFNTPEVLALFHDWRSRGLGDLLRRGLALFGLESLAEHEAAPSEVAELAERRVAARSGRDFETADRLRGEIEKLGWEMRDEPDGYTLVRRSS